MRFLGISGTGTGAEGEISDFFEGFTAFFEKNAFNSLRGTGKIDSVIIPFINSPHHWSPL